jgi:hypothetical protein
MRRLLRRSHAPGYGTAFLKIATWCGVALGHMAYRKPSPVAFLGPDGLSFHRIEALLDVFYLEYGLFHEGFDGLEGSTFAIERGLRQASELEMWRSHCRNGGELTAFHEGIEHKYRQISRLNVLLMFLIFS